ncbi:MAG: DUF167 domain-containing protein [Actinomycetota bacterium]
MLDVRQKDGRVRVSARIRPRARPGLEVTDGGLVIRVAAVPEKGRATEEALRLLASALGVAPSAVELRTGAAARRKTFVVSGVSATDARSRLLAATG